MQHESDFSTWQPEFNKQISSRSLLPHTVYNNGACQLSTMLTSCRAGII